MADFAGAKAAIRQRLVDLWTATPIAFQNEKPEGEWPPVDADGFASDAWVLLEVEATRSAMRGAGSPGQQIWVDEGFIYVHVFVPTGSGDQMASQHATAIGELFRGAVFYRETPGCYVRTWAPRIDGGGSGDDNGNWFRITMSVPFEYWHLG
ncbi:hypothetical protein [Devosia aurantiaca]|uniref:Tail terminator n=1 Tax=Devosia aurantiaca TaxID=2714858 RepID=A0A6M1SP68_9HYPH|nr:hypothetical protein [Devosia aurantiaca]NGP18920.1 hypothetical protein [Devosia aurantiaca]